MRTLVVSKEPRRDGMVLAWSREPRGPSTVQVSAAEKKSDAVEMANKQECEWQAPMNKRKEIKYECAS